MTWTLHYTKQAQKDAKKLASSGLKSKAQALLAILEKDPWQNPPPFEKLVGDLSGAYWSIRKAIEAIEKNKKHLVTVLAEPQMGKRGLYPTLSTKKSGEEVRLMMDLISLCDGKNTLLQIAETLNTPIWELYELVDKLVTHKLLQENE